MGRSQPHSGAPEVQHRFASGVVTGARGGQVVEDAGSGRTGALPFGTVPRHLGKRTNAYANPYAGFDGPRGRRRRLAQSRPSVPSWTSTRRSNPTSRHLRIGGAREQFIVRFMEGMPLESEGAPTRPKSEAPGSRTNPAFMGSGAYDGALFGLTERRLAHAGSRCLDPLGSGHGSTRRARARSCVRRTLSGARGPGGRAGTVRARLRRSRRHRPSARIRMSLTPRRPAGQVAPHHSGRRPELRRQAAHHSSPGSVRESAEELPEYPRLRRLMMLPVRDGERELIVVADPMGIKKASLRSAWSRSRSLQLLDGTVSHRHQRRGRRRARTCAWRT